MKNENKIQSVMNSMKTFQKLAQSMDNNDILLAAQKMLNGIIGTWFTNNGVNAHFKYSFQESSDPGFDFDLKLNVASPTPNTPIASPFPNLSEKIKSDLVQILAKSPLLRDKSVKVDVETDLGKTAELFDIAEKIAIKLGQYLAPPQSLEPNKPILEGLVRDTDGETILSALPQPVKAAVKNLEVARSHDPTFEKEVRVLFHPGKASDEVFQGVENTVHKLQMTGLLRGKSYLIKEVG